MRYVELVMLFVAVMSPQFILARSVGTDEMAKASAGAVIGGLMITAYKMWKSPASEKDDV